MMSTFSINKYIVVYVKLPESQINNPTSISWFLQQIYDENIYNLFQPIPSPGMESPPEIDKIHFA